VGGFGQLIEHDCPELKGGQNHRHQKDVSIDRRLALNEFKFTRFLLSGLFKELFDAVVICFSRVRDGRNFFPPLGRDLIHDDIFLTLSHHDNPFYVFTLGPIFSYMDTQVCPYVIAPLIQILARRSYNIKSDGK